MIKNHLMAFGRLNQKILLLVGEYAVGTGLLSLIIFRFPTVPFIRWETEMAWVSVLQLAGSLLVLYLSGFRLTSMISIYLLFLYLFSYGQVVVEGFFPRSYMEVYSIAKDFTIPIYVSGTLFTFEAISALVAGVLLSKLRVEHPAYVHLKELVPTDYFGYCRPVGWLMLAVSAPFMLVMDAVRLVVSIRSGYIAALDVSFPGFFGTLYAMTLPAIALLLTAYRDRRWLTRGLFGLIVAYKCVFMLVGNRGFNTLFIFVLLYFYLTVIERIPPKKVIAYVLAGALIVFLALVSFRAIAYIRDVKDKSLPLLLLCYGRALHGDFIVENLYEYGVTLRTACTAVKFMPAQVGYAHGATYLASMATVLPNIHGILNGAISVAHWPSKLDKLFGGGTGGSFIAEFYFNFGWAGFPAAAVAGVLFGRLSDAWRKAAEEKRYLHIAVYMLIFYYLLWWIRDAFESTFRASVWTAILVFAWYQAIKFIKKRGGIPLFHRKKDTNESAE